MRLRPAPGPVPATAGPARSGYRAACAAPCAVAAVRRVVVVEAAAEACSAIEEPVERIEPPQGAALCGYACAATAPAACPCRPGTAARRRPVFMRDGGGGPSSGDAPPPAPAPARRNIPAAWGRRISGISLMPELYRRRQIAQLEPAGPQRRNRGGLTHTAAAPASLRAARQCTHASQSKCSDAQARNTHSSALVSPPPVAPARPSRVGPEAAAAHRPARAATAH